METPKKVENCPVCEPIINLLEFLLKNGFVILEQKCSDYHFHEMYFKLLAPKMFNYNSIDIKSIGLHESGIYYCECHWSRVEIIKE